MDAIFWMASGDGFECRFQVGEGLHAVDFAGFDARGDASPIAAALVVASEERVLTIKGNRADEIFGVVGVDFDAAVGQEGLQSAPITMDIGQFFAEA